MNSIDKLMYNDGSSINYDERFMQVIEDHLTYIRSHETTELIEIENEVAHKSEGNLTSLLQDLGIEASMHWVIMRVNGYESPMQYKSSETELLIPGTNIIGDLLGKYRVNQSK